MSLAYQLKRSKRRKTLAITVKNGLVTVHAPNSMKLSLIEQCVNKKQAWILKHLSQQRLLDPNRTILDWDEMTLFNDCYQIQWLVNQATTDVSHQDNVVIIRTSKRVKRVKETQFALMSKFCAEQLHVYCEIKATELAKQIGKEVMSVRIKHFKRRWGSCDNRGNLQFNLQLVLAPVWVIDYVIAHEVAHLAVLNHSAQFWQRVTELCLNYQDAEKWLKQNGLLLDVFKI